MSWRDVGFYMMGATVGCTIMALLGNADIRDLKEENKRALDHSNRSCVRLHIGDQWLRGHLKRADPNYIEPPVERQEDAPPTKERRPVLGEIHTDG